MSDALQIAIDASKKGAEKALLYFGKNPEVTIKPDNTPVTLADKEAEAAIKDFILSKQSHAKFIGEETGGDLETDEARIIDPVDGTKDFMRGLSTWGILIAHYKDGICDIGVCFMPALNQLCYAEKGKGAFVNEKRVHVSSIANISDAYLVNGELRYFENRQSLINLTDQVFTERCLGDPSKYVNLAAGKVDIVVDGRNHAWDSAPFSVIIPEAGGKVSNLNGKPWSIHDLDFVATNGVIHDQVIEILHIKQ